MYKSTRGEGYKSSMEAILEGLAPDGGLYMPDNIPAINYNELINLSYQEMASKIINIFFPEFSYDLIYKEVVAAYKSFDIENVVDIKKLGASYILELFHGPTLAFKDLALVVLPRLMRLSKKMLGVAKDITILTATSGDTGGATLNGFKDIDGINIIVLYPNNGVSEIQERQMCSFRGDHSRVLAIKGNFDDCQSFVKSFFNTHKDLNLSSANSINIGRLIPQVVYYFYTYIYLLNRGEITSGEEIVFSVPTGNFGNILAAIIAKMAGLPIKNLICASNKNDVLTSFFRNGEYNKNREFYKTNSPSMDILISSNLERLLYLEANCDSKIVNELMESLNRDGIYSFKNNYKYIYAYKTDEERTLEVIREVYNKFNYLIDPHTAVAYNAYLEYKKEFNDKVVIVSTASPFKFPSAILDSFNIKYSSNDNLLEKLKDSFNISIPKCLRYPEAIKDIHSLDNLDKEIEEMIKC